MARRKGDKGEEKRKIGREEEERKREGEGEMEVIVWGDIDT